MWKDSGSATEVDDFRARGGVNRVKPILPGARGPAVEDIQKRLLKLGYDLGPTGIDGVFLGMTRDAVLEFQSRHELDEDGVVGAASWAALVDATFTFGDRMLYLRLPYLHGHDVQVLQHALSTLGFACGDPDSIFGPFTERAVREFQRSSGQPADGIVGPETVGSLVGLKHVWEGKNASVPASPSTPTIRATDVLARWHTVVESESEQLARIGERLANVAAAADERIHIRLLRGGDATEPSCDLHLILVEKPSQAAESLPVVVLGHDPESLLAARVVTALATQPEKVRRLVIAVGVVPTNERDQQRVAVRLLDALCLALA